MVRIAILDDNAESLNRNKVIVENILEKNKVAYKIDSFDKSMELLFSIDHGAYYDMFLLDVAVPAYSGLDVAREIRKHYFEPVIIYVSNYVEYAIPAFKVNTYRYIPKEDRESELPEAIQSILPKICESKKKFYKFHYYLDVEIVSFDDIYYIQKEGKYVIFSHRKGESRERDSFQNVLKKLDSEEFVKIGSSTAVNISHIMSLTENEVVMRNGVRLSVSRSWMAKIREEILKYWK